MALIDILTDGTDTIDLADAFDGFTDKLSYKQQIVEKNALGEYPLVTEQLAVNWNQDDDDFRYDEHEMLMRLKRKAEKWSNGDYREGPVWRKLQSNSEGGPKYMIVHDVQIVELGGTFYGPDATSKPVVLEIAREGALWLIEPDDAMKLLVAFSPTVVYDYVVGGNKNHITIMDWLSNSTYGIEGDADGILKITMSPSASYNYESDNQITIAKRTATAESTLNGFNPHFNPVDLVAATGSEHTLTTDSQVPGGKRLDIANASGSEVERYYVWSYDPDYYQGTFMMMMAIQMTGANDYCYVTPFHSEVAGVGYPSQLLSNEVHVPKGHSAVYQKIFAGLITLPPSGYTPPSENEPPSYGIGFKLRIPNGMGCRMLNWWLVPADEGIQEIRDVGSSISPFLMNSVVVDGSIAHSYIKSTNMSPFPVQTNGRYLVADHQKITRLYFFKSYWYETTGVDAIEKSLTSMSVKIEGVPRVKALAGDYSYT